MFNDAFSAFFTGVKNPSRASEIGGGGGGKSCKSSFSSSVTSWITGGRTASKLGKNKRIVFNFKLSI
jgi:hypothetical protein